MNTSALKIIYGVLASVSMTAQSSPSGKNNSSPNIVYILADDLGIVNLGCYTESQEFPFYSRIK